MRARALLAVAFGFGLTIAACDETQPAAEGADGATPPTELPAGEQAEALETERAEPETTGIGKIDAIRGTVTWTRGENVLTAEPGAAVEAGDAIETGADGKARLVLSDETIVAIGDNTSIVLKMLDHSPGKRRGSLAVNIGKFWAKLVDWTGGDSLWTFETPNAVAGVRGTTLWGDTKVDAICALEGEIEVTSKVQKKKKKRKAKVAKLKAGQCASKLSKGKTKKMKPTAKQVEKYLSEVLIAD